MNRLLIKYRNLSAPMKASLWFAVCNILQKGIVYFSTPIVIRILPTDQFGEYTVFQSWYQIVSVFATLNLSAGVYNNGLTKFNADKKRFIGAMQGLSTSTTALLLVFFATMPQFWESLLKLNGLLILGMFVQMFFEPAFLFWAAEQRYMYKYSSLVAVTVIMTLGSTIAGILAVLYIECKAETYILSFVAVHTLIGICFYINNLRKGRIFYDSKYWKYALKFNLPLIPHYLSMTVLNQSDRIMIGAMVGKAEAGIYWVAYTTAMLMTIVTTAINNSFIPYTYKSLKAKNYKDIKGISNSLLMIVGSGCIGAMAFAPELIKVFAEAEYYDAIWAMPPVAASAYFMFLYPFFANIEFYYEKTKFIMIASCVGATTNIVLNYIFIGLFGYLAAGYTTLICYILFAFAHYLFYKKIIREEIQTVKGLYDIRFILFFSLLIIVAMIGITLVYNNLLVRYIILISLVIVAICNRKRVLKLFESIKTPA